MILASSCRIPLYKAPRSFSGESGDLVESPQGDGLLPYASFGMASHAAGSHRRSLLAEAQANAAMGRIARR